MPDAHGGPGQLPDPDPAPPLAVLRGQAENIKLQTLERRIPERAAKGFDIAAPCQDLEPLGRNRIPAPANPGQTSGCGPCGIGIVSQVHRRKQTILVAVESQQTPKRGFQGMRSEERRVGKECRL